MEKIEFEKLEWMMSKPMKTQRKASEESEEAGSSAARFDFSGQVLRPDADISVRAGLHHHGNEPEAPGYTLDELFTLARSKFSQQRVLALQTLANIVTRCHEGVYADEIKSGNSAIKDDESRLDDSDNLIHQMIDGGLLFLLRWSLDDQTESILVAALDGIRALVQPPGQEEALDWHTDFHASPVCFSLHPFSPLLDSGSPFKLDANLNISEKRQLSELPDDEYIKHDLIGGLMRMSLIERFRYLIDRYQPQLAYRQLSANMFLILFRLLRHSSEFCFEFNQKYDQFVDLLASKFLPFFISGC